MKKNNALLLRHLERAKRNVAVNGMAMAIEKPLSYAFYTI